MKKISALYIIPIVFFLGFSFLAIKEAVIKGMTTSRAKELIIGIPIIIAILFFIAYIMESDKDEQEKAYRDLMKDI